MIQTCGQGRAVLLVPLLQPLGHLLKCSKLLLGMVGAQVVIRYYLESVLQ
jgi:hypothetical protein